MQPANLHDVARDLNLGQNVPVAAANDHCLRLAVNQDSTYDWHSHPDTDELFVVLEGELVIEARGQDTVTLRPGGAFTVPAGRIHRTIARGRTVNLCFESRTATTVFAAAGA